MSTTRGKRWLLASAATGAAILLGATAIASRDVAAAPRPAGAAIQVPQVGQPGATDHEVRHEVDTGSKRLCQRGAAWVRPHFARLKLAGTDTVTVTGAGGDSFLLTSAHGQNRAVSTKSFAGECVTITANLSEKTSTAVIDSVQSGDAMADVVVAGAGDICGSNCSQTADLVRDINPSAVFLAGDNAYENGSLSDYNQRYHPAWGPFKSITHPSPGNHEYQTSGASGYFDYFNGSGNASGPAGERGKGYYSWDVGDWHFIALNSNIGMSAGSAQEQWLRNDLRASTKPCTAAYWHHPLFTRGSHSNSTSTRPLWQALYDNKADLVMVGHDHNYQRYALQSPTGAADANGIRQVLVGTGGRAFYDFTRTMPNVEASNDNTFGVLKLSLSATGYRGEFVPIEGRTFTDNFSGSCHPKAGTGPNFALGANPGSVRVAPGAAATTKITVTSSGGYSAATDLAVSGLPSGVTATVSPATVTPPAGGTAEATVTVNASTSATTGTSTVTVTGTSGTLRGTTTFALAVGSGGEVFFDDFEAVGGWQVNPSSSDSASTGQWERGDPEATEENGAKQLGTTTSGVNCLVTGRLAGSGTGVHDVDGGRTSVRSPEIALPAGTRTLTFRWSIGFGANATSADYLTVKVGNLVVLAARGNGSHQNGSWRTATADLSQFAGQTVRILIEAADDSAASLVEAQIDDVRIT